MKRCCKALANFLALLLALPCFLAYCACRMVLGPARAFPGWSQALSLLPGHSGVYVRRAFYRLVLPRCSADSWLGFGTVISHASAEVGQHAYVGVYCCLGDVVLHKDVLIGSHVSISNGGEQHGSDRLDIPMREQPGKFPRVTIGQDTWIGDRAVVLADIGAHCIIGAGSVVTRPIPDYAIAVGVPARVVRFRTGVPQPTQPTEAMAASRREWTRIS